MGRTSYGDCARARDIGRPRRLPVDEGSARDLRAMAPLADEDAQLTGLCALAHSPNARAGAADEEIFSGSGREKESVAGFAESAGCLWTRARPVTCAR